MCEQRGRRDRRHELGAQEVGEAARGGPADGDRGGPCRGSRRGRGLGVHDDGGHERDRRASASSESRPVSVPTATRGPKARSGTPSARRAVGRGAEQGVACSRRTRAPHTPPRPRRRHTSRLRRTASARARAHGAARPRRGRAHRAHRSWAERGPEPSSVCGARAPRVQRLGRHARATRTRPPRTRGPPAASAPRSGSHRDDRRWSAEKCAQTASSSGRSTWQETTAYRSRDVAPIVLEAR